MATFFRIVDRYSVVRWWTASVLLFWLSTLVVTFIDFAGERWFGFSWPSGPDLFPNQVLGMPLALCQILAGAFLLAAAVRLARVRGGFLGAAIAAGLVAVTAVGCFVAFVFIGLWYHVDVMGRTL